MIAYVKLKNTEDIVAHVVDESNEWIIIEDPVCFAIDPHNGLFAKEWIMHSTINTIKIYKSDIFMVSQANREAIKFYNQFKNRHASKKITVSDEELEGMFIAMMESKTSIKH